MADNGGFFRKILDIRTLKFLAVGVLNTIVGMGIMLLISALFNRCAPTVAARRLFVLGTTEYTVSYLVASAANYVVGGTVSYFLNRYWTFKAGGRTARTVVRFIATIVICYAVAYLCAKPLAELALKKTALSDGLKEVIALTVGAVLYTVLNYFAQRFLVFTDGGKAKAQDDLSEEDEKDPPHCE